MSEQVTIAGTYTAEIEVKRSRFIALLQPLSSEEEVKSWLAGLAERYRDADHICYAYRLAEPFREKAFDAGEPRGTAGRPILNQLQKRGLIDCGLAVVRYFGGTKLGAGGLARAYGQAAAEVIARARLQPWVRWAKRKVELDYGSYERLKRFLEERQGEEVSVQFGERVSAEIRLPEKALPELEQFLLEEEKP